MANNVVQDVVVAPNENWSSILTPGQVLRIVDLEGKQAVDFLCYNADDPADRYNAAIASLICGMKEAEVFWQLV